MSPESSPQYRSIAFTEQEMSPTHTNRTATADNLSGRVEHSHQSVDTVLSAVSDFSTDAPHRTEPIRNADFFHITGPARSNEPLQEAGSARNDDEGKITTKESKPRECSSWLKLQDNWTWEALSILWANLCLAANIIILASMSGKRLSLWTLPIKSNTLVGVFSTLARAALLAPITSCISQLKWLYFAESGKPLLDMQRFDDASRGPLGSLSFLQHLIFGKGSSNNSRWASLGCIITLAALALEPFTQQIISFRERMVVISEGKGDARFTVAEAYDNGNKSLSGTWSPEFTDYQMQGALLAGLYSQTLDTSSYETCSSSNCTWPAATSLSICSACQNVTKLSSKKCSDNTEGISVEPMTCNYTTPSNLTLHATTGAGPSSTFFYTMLNASAANIFSSGTTHGPNDQDKGALLGLIGVLRIPTDNGASTGQPDHGLVDECRLYWCKTNYSPSSQLANSSRFAAVTHEPLLYNLSKSGVNPITEQQDLNTYISISDSQGTKYLLNSVDLAGAMEMIQVLFDTALGSQVSSAAGEVDSTSGFNIARLLYRANLTAIFDNIATSMTAQLRSGRNITEISGQAWNIETYIHVQWAWFALPIVLAIMTMVLQGVTVRMNKRVDGWLWKSSVLPYMFVGRRWGVDEGGTEGGVGYMETVASRTTVQNADFKKRRLS